jgi:hypothetical protein
VQAVLFSRGGIERMAPVLRNAIRLVGGKVRRTAHD